MTGIEKLNHIKTIKLKSKINSVNLLEKKLINIDFTYPINQLQ